MSEEANTTLLFRHLPNDLSEDERKDLLHHLGATQVRVFGKHGSMKNTAFAVFKDETQAKQIVSQLHQVEFLGSRLIVEFARTGKDKAPSVVDKDGVCVKSTDATQDEEGQLTSTAQRQLRDPKEIRFDTAFHTWGVHHPRCPDLHYKYPPPTPSILTNILHALAATPRFYVQVLHLMNKMDLPAPFGMVTPPPPVRPDVLPDDVAQTEMDISSSAESELDSDGDQKRPQQMTKTPKKVRQRPVKRPRLSELQDVPQVPSSLHVAVSEIFDSTTPAKRIALKLPPSIPLPSLHHTRIPPDGFQGSILPPLPSEPPPPLPPSTDKPKIQDIGGQSSQSSDLYDPSCPLPVHLDEEPLLYGPQPPPPPPPPPVHASSFLPSDATKTDTTSDHQCVVGGFGILQPVQKVTGPVETEESSEKEWTQGKFISSSQLRRDRLSKSEMQDLSVFRRYSEGQPSCRLYIKNLAKQVLEEDLHWIYGRYVDWAKEQTIFDIRLMKEGRMKGQAFVTLPSEDMATKALKDTNGFLLKEKPMVVQFARSARAEEDKASMAKE